MPPSSQDDLLVERLRRGDEAAFTQIVDAWSGGMRRLAMSYVGSMASADEVVQDAWLAVIERCFPDQETSSEDNALMGQSRSRVP